MKTFKISYPTGYIQLNIGQFFGTANKKRIEKVLRLARVNCTEHQRLELIEGMTQEIIERECAIEKLGNLRAGMIDILICFYTDGPLPRIEPSSYEKALSVQIKKLTDAIGWLREDEWLP